MFCFLKKYQSGIKKLTTKTINTLKKGILQGKINNYAAFLKLLHFSIPAFHNNSVYFISSRIVKPFFIVFNKFGQPKININIY